LIPERKSLDLRYWLLALTLLCQLPLGLWAQEDRLLFLPGESVFNHLIGDPREFQSSLIAELTQERFDGSIAATPEFLQWIQSNGTKWGWGIEGDTFIQVESPGYGHYSLTDSNYYLVLPERVSDWYLGTYFSESYGDFSNRLEFLHVSSQLGDGFFDSTKSFPYLQESFRFTASYQATDRIRFYMGTGYYTEAIPEEAPCFIQMGTELYTSSFDMMLATTGRGYFTYDLQASQSLGGVFNQNFAVGFQWKWKKETHQAIRLALIYYNGNNDFGQFYRQNDNHWALGLFFDP
jgi:hypothetical protein